MTVKKVRKCPKCGVLQFDAWLAFCLTCGTMLQESVEEVKVETKEKAEEELRKYDWYEGIQGEISSLKEKMPKEYYNDYGLDLLIRIAKRVEGFSLQCEECSIFKEMITIILAGISDWPNTTKEQKQNYKLAFWNITKHLKEQHGLAKEGWSLWKSALIGGVLGVVAGLIGILLAMQETNIYDREASLIGAPLLVLLGLIIGTILGCIIGLIINIVRRQIVDLSK